MGHKILQESKMMRSKKRKAASQPNEVELKKSILISIPVWSLTVSTKRKKTRCSFPKAMRVRQREYPHRD